MAIVELVTAATLLSSPTESPPRPPFVLVQSWRDEQTISKNPIVISTLVRLGLGYEQQALVLLQNQQVEGASSAKALATEGYVQIRQAAAGIRLKLQAAKFGDPLLEGQLERIEDARQHNLVAISYLGPSTDPAQLTSAIEHLERVVSLLEGILLLMP